MGEPTVVINLSGHRDHPDYDPALNPQIVYLGRRQWWGRGRLLDGHPLANRYSVGKYGRDVALNLYRNDLVRRPDLEQQLEALRGRILACWCHPLPCHCHIVAELIDQRTGGAR